MSQYYSFNNNVSQKPKKPKNKFLIFTVSFVLIAGIGAGVRFVVSNSRSVQDSDNNESVIQHVTDNDSSLGGYVSVSASPVSTFQNENGKYDFDFEKTALAQSVPDDVKELSEYIYSKVKKYNNTMYIDYKNISKDIIHNAVSYLRIKHPECFWLTGGSSWQQQADGTYFIELDIVDGIPENNISEMSDELEQKVESVLSQIPENASDYEKVLFINDYLVENTVYNKDIDLTGTAYYCLIKNTARCEGYARAFQLFMNRLGIECGYVTGIAQELHAWNYVKIDGDYYWIDVTWNDPVMDDGTSVKTYKYFLLDDESMYQEHKNDDTDNFFIPECTSVKMNYYVVNGLFFDSYDEKKITEIIENNIKNGTVEIRFSSYDAYNTCLTELITNKKIWNLVPSVYGKTVWHSEEPDLCILSFEI